ncbi:MAG: phosphopyruvate hydratase [Candidatus Dojkabacteria bacterium]|nr:phosphopyruvate hydratase [Candidatus Dojkabacteria bacterium]
MKITNIQAQEVLDSRGNPTVECTVTLENGVSASAIVPSGASTGTHEAVELRDGDEKRYLGKGVLKAVDNVNTKIAEVVVGMDVENQKEIDQAMISLDGTENKSELGANAILSVSMACVRAAATYKEIPLYEYVAQLFGNDTNVYEMPVPMINILNGGRHANGSSDIQEYMIMPIGASNLQEAVQWGSEVFHNLGKILKEMGYPTTVGDEGGYAPNLNSNEKPLELIVEAIKKSGFKPGEDIAIAIDAAASEFYKDGKYELKIEGGELSKEQLLDIYIEWVDKYPLISIEDGFAEDDWDGFKLLEDKLGERIINVGDDLFVTNIKRLERGIEMECANAILIKLNQIGTVSETIEVIKKAEENGFHSIISHRSGETEDTFIADFAVGSGVGFIKTGSMSRSERVAKYNRLMRIERELS